MQRSLDGAGSRDRSHVQRVIATSRRGVALSLIASASLLAVGQEPGTSSSNSPPPRVDRHLSDDYVVRSWRQADGLPSDQVTCLVQGGDGYLWVGTSAGLARFDGVRFVRFDHGNVVAFPDQRILGVAEDGDGTLWVTHGDKGLAGFGTHGWEVPGMGGEELDPAYWLRARGGGSVLGRLTTGAWIAPVLGDGGPGAFSARIDRRRDLPKEAIEVLEGIREPRIVVTAAEVQVESPGGQDLQRFSLPKPTVPSRVVAVAVRVAPDSVWILSGEYGVPGYFRLHHLAAGRLVTIDPEVPQPRVLPATIVGDRGRGVWHGAGNGYLGRASVDGRIRYRVPGSGPDAHPVALTEGLGETLWLAVENMGLLEIRPRRFLGIRESEGLPHGMVRSVLPDRGEGVWAGTDDGLARVLTRGAVDAWGVVAMGLSGHTIRALTWDSEGTLWAGSSRGLFTLRQGRWEERDLPRLPVGASDGEGLGSVKVRDLMSGRGGEVWVVTAHQLAMAPSPRAALSTVAFLPTLMPTDVLEDHEGNRWLATERGGVVVLGAEAAESLLVESLEPVPGQPGNRWRCVPRAWLSETNGLPSDHIWEMVQDREQTIWMAGPRGLLRLPREAARSVTQGNGIPHRLEDAPFVFTSRHGLPELALNSLVDDGRGSLWIGGDLGVYRIPQESFRSVAQGRTPVLSVQTYRSSDGLPADETNGRISHPGAVRDGSGRVWMATIRGLACVAPESDGRAGVAPGVVIEEIRADGRILATTLPQEPDGGVVATQGSSGTWNAGPGIGAVRSLKGPVVVGPGGGRVLEIRFTGMDPDSPGLLRFRYQMEGYENSPHEVGDRRVAYFTNLDPGTYRFRVWAVGRSGVWSEDPAELEITLRPQLWQTWWFRVLGGLLVAGTIAAAGAWRVNRIRQFEDMRRRAERADLRNRLARDLHDGIGSGLARLAVLAHLPEGDVRDPNRVQHQFRELSGAVRELAQTVREISWTARPSAISLESLMAQITQQAGEFLGAAGIRCGTSLPMEFPALQLDPEQRSDLYFAAKEAVTNIVRHSRATEARFDVELAAGSLRMVLWDNGRGANLPGEAVQASRAGHGTAGSGGNGLPNLLARVTSLGGQMTVETCRPDGGTRVRIEVPMAALGGRSTAPEKEG